jgi:hypothetical protein
VGRDVGLMEVGLKDWVHDVVCEDVGKRARRDEDDLIMFMLRFLGVKTMMIWFVSFSEERSRSELR